MKAKRGPIPKRLPSRYKYEGYLAFRVMSDLYLELFPTANSIDGGSRKAAMIFRALSKAYTDGIEDAAQMDEEDLGRIRRRIFASPKRKS